MLLFWRRRTFFGRVSFEIQNDLIFPTSFVLKEKIIHTNKVICFKPDCFFVLRGKRTTHFSAPYIFCMVQCGFDFLCTVRKSSFLFHALMGMCNLFVSVGDFFS